MADRFFGVVVGGQLTTDVSEAASTTSRAVELRINDSAYTDKQLVLNAVEAIRSYLIAKETNPIA